MHVLDLDIMIILLPLFECVLKKFRNKIKLCMISFITLRMEIHVVKKISKV